MRESVIQLIQSTPGLTSAQIASRLNVSREALLSLLYDDLKGIVVADRSYGWWMAGQIPANDPQDEPVHPNVPAGQPLRSRLLRYYLECVKRDRPHEVSFPILNEGADFVSLPLLPLAPLNWEALPADPEIMAMQAKDSIKEEKEILHVGYPVRIVPDGAGHGLRVEPLFIFPAESADLHKWQLIEEAFSINTSILRSDEVVSLLTQLGLGTPDAFPPWDEIFRRLQTLYPEWIWREELNTSTLASEPAIAALNSDGYYNRSILFSAPPPKYTSGLETELRWLLAQPATNFNHTALNCWIEGNPGDVANEASPLLEVIPLNEEQRAAVRSAMGAPLTVITGPPGTGKSQVVSSIIVNAVYQGKRVLFACRNNKPVDVVASRVNNLAPLPLLQRVGRREDTPLLRQSVDSLLVAPQNPGQLEQEQFFQERQTSLGNEREAITKELDSLIEARNVTMRTRQGIEKWIRVFPLERWEAIRSLELKSWIERLRTIDTAINEATKSTKPFFIRLFWGFYTQQRLGCLQQAMDKINLFAKPIGLPPMTMAVTEANLPAISEAYKQLTTFQPMLEKARAYIMALSELAMMRRVEDFASGETQLGNQIVETSGRLWKCWLNLRPQRLQPQEREHLHEFSAQLALLEGENPRWRDYFRAYEQVARVLPCAWGLTALKARGLPSKPGLFDLLVMDEAAAGDIASAIPLLYRCRRAVIIGDKNQMSHITQLSATQDRAIREKLELAVPGCAKWSFVANSLFSLAAAIVPTKNIFKLKDHHRSHRHIIEFSNKHFYGGDLRVLTRYAQLKGLLPGQPAVTWEPVAGRVIRPPSGSAFNSEEAHRVADVVRGLDADCSIGVVTPFRKQKELIEDLLEGHGRVLVGTAHDFQGDERDIIVFSPVVSDGMPETSLNFLRQQFNLFNVAVTRARSRLIIVGDRAAARNSGVQYLSSLVTYVGELHADEVFVHVQDMGAEYPKAKRAEAHPAEIALYAALYAAGLRPMPRLQVDQYQLQFALWNGQEDGLRQNVEIDEIPTELWTREHVRRMALRDQRLLELGWRIIRFYVHEVEDDVNSCVKRVKEKWRAGASCDELP